MNDDLRKTDAAASVATFIGVVKWVLIGLYFLAAIVTVLVFLASGDTSIETIGAPADDDTSIAGAVVAGTLGWAVVGSLITWVLLGWFQHTLGMLSMIARNTQPPPAQYYQG